MVVVIVFQMSSIDLNGMVSSQLQEHPSTHIQRAILEYEEGYESQEEIPANSDNKDCPILDLENKRSLKIKPLNMFKDVISLRKENVQKKQIVKQLQSQNEQLRNEYNQCVAHNDQLEHFFKEVQFTFQPERKKVHASEVMLRAKKNLYQQAKEAKQRMKKFFKNGDTSAIQELKAYISTLEEEKQSLVRKVRSLKEQVAQRVKEEDFNCLQAQKFQQTCQNIRKTLNLDIKNVTTRHEEYKTEKMLIQKKVKAKHFQAEKKKYREECQQMKALLLEQEGLQYEIGLLKQRIKNKKKETNDYDSLVERIKNKETNNQRLEKDLREKKKTSEYMEEWTKELKKQLEGKKAEHLKKKAEDEAKINFLTSQYEKYTQIYKAGLFQEQAAKRKGSRQISTINDTQKPVHIKVVTFQQIKNSVRSMSFFLLDNYISFDDFSSDILKCSTQKREKQVKKVRVKTTISLANLPKKDMVTTEDICHNFESSFSHNLAKQQYTKVAQYIVEDGIEQKKTININIAKQILKNLLKRDIENEDDLQQAQQGLSKILKKFGDAMRPELRLAGGCEEQIDINSIRTVLAKYGEQPYYCNLYGEFMEFYGWRKRKSIGFLKLEDYDAILTTFGRAHHSEQEEMLDE